MRNTSGTPISPRNAKGSFGAEATVSTTFGLHCSFQLTQSSVNVRLVTHLQTPLPFAVLRPPAGAFFSIPRQLLAKVEGTGSVSKNILQKFAPKRVKFDLKPSYLSSQRVGKSQAVIERNWVRSEKQGLAPIMKPISGVPLTQRSVLAGDKGMGGSRIDPGNSRRNTFSRGVVTKDLSMLPLRRCRLCETQIRSGPWALAVIRNVKKSLRKGGLYRSHSSIWKSSTVPSRSGWKVSVGWTVGNSLIGVLLELESASTPQLRVLGGQVSWQISSLIIIWNWLFPAFIPLLMLYWKFCRCEWTVQCWKLMTCPARTGSAHDITSRPVSFEARHNGNYEFWIPPKWKICEQSNCSISSGHLPLVQLNFLRWFPSFQLNSWHDSPQYLRLQQSLQILFYLRFFLAHFMLNDVVRCHLKHF